MMDSDNSTNGGNNGNRGKFIDRLRKIRIGRLKKQKNIFLDEEEKLNFKVVSINVFKVFLTMPLIINNNIMNRTKLQKATSKGNTKENSVSSGNIFINSCVLSKCAKVSEENLDGEVKIKNFNVSLLQKKLKRQ